MLRLMLWLSRHLGRSFSRKILVGISLYFIIFVPKARRASRAYLQRVLEWPPTWRDIFRHFYAFSSIIHDRIYLLDDRLDLFNIDVVDTALLRENHGVVLIGAHFGSFEIMRAVGRNHVHKCVSMLMYEENAHNINATLAFINPDAVNDIIPLGRIESMLRAQERLAAGHLVAMLADRTLRQDNLRWCPFLGDMAPFPLGPFRMAALLRSSVVFMAGVYLGGNRYIVHFDPLADFSNMDHSECEAAILTAQDRYVEKLAHFCRQVPYNWFNFFDFWTLDGRTQSDSPSDRLPSKANDEDNLE